MKKKSISDSEKERLRQSWYSAESFTKLLTGVYLRLRAQLEDNLRWGLNASLPPQAAAAHQLLSQLLSFCETSYSEAADSGPERVDKLLFKRHQQYEEELLDCAVAYLPLEGKSLRLNALQQLAYLALPSFVRPGDEPGGVERRYIVQDSLYREVWEIRPRGDGTGLWVLIREMRDLSWTSLNYVGLVNFSWNDWMARSKF